MNVVFRYIIFGLLSIFAILMISKGTELWLVAANVNGDGIGIQFLGLEINDQVSAKEISRYAIGFFIASLVAIVGGFFVIARSSVKTNERSVN
ncbi:hypothetical protein [Metabacillus litoralis]|uniref:hypothetical protein n=1 Tax=Metabacillus litoralis TaxID=152268 RepID=UPI001CFF4A64|nr:hypothetical protein [Metabacillus litoralis]